MTDHTATPRRPRYDWHAIAAELCPNADVCALAGRARGLHRPIYRQQLQSWRNRLDDPFPAPAIVVDAGIQSVDLWARTDVEAWLARNYPSS